MSEFRIGDTIRVAVPYAAIDGNTPFASTRPAAVTLTPEVVAFAEGQLDAVLAERERCARLAEAYSAEPDPCLEEPEAMVEHEAAGERIAERIRAGPVG